MPLHKMHEPTYHGKPADAHTPKVLGKQALLRRYPWIKAAMLRAVSKNFPVAVTEEWSDLAGPTPEDPLLRQVLPDPRELIALPGDLPDPVGDRAKSPVPWLVQKHSDRALLLVTKRCQVYCRYCFRRDHSPGEQMDPSPAELENAIQTAVHSGAHELILSGGDPLALTDEKLDGILNRVRPHFPILRIHSRAPITAPSRVTPGLISLLVTHRPIWMVVHANHPSELGTGARESLRLLTQAGIQVLNQSVLLRGVNDDAAVLADLSRELVQLGVLPYYLHHTDPVPGNGHFRVDVHRGLAIHEALKQQLSGVALPAYVVDLPGGQGKIPVEEAHRKGMIG